MEVRNVPHIVDLGDKEIIELLTRINFGHLGLCRRNRPYVVPIHFAYHDPKIFFYTTEGLKTEIIDENPTVCLQVEDITDRQDWQSVIITGPAERLTAESDIKTAMGLIKAVNPQLSPAWSVRWLDDWVRSNVEAVYRIHPESTTGRKTLKKIKGDV